MKTLSSLTSFTAARLFAAAGVLFAVLGVAWPLFGQGWGGFPACLICAVFCFLTARAEGRRVRVRRQRARAVQTARYRQDAKLRVAEIYGLEDGYGLIGAAARVTKALADFTAAFGSGPVVIGQGGGGGGSAPSQTAKVISVPPLRRAESATEAP